MRLALFATDTVGREVAEFLAARGDPPTCLVLDAVDRAGQNAAIRAAAGVPDDRVVTFEKSSEAALALRLREWDVDLGLLAWWPHLVRGDLLAGPRRGYLNFHCSLLPHGRGKDPNFWGIVERQPLGATIHWVNPGIDSGDVAFQESMDLTWEDTGKSVYERSRALIVDLFKRSWPRIRTGDIPRFPQAADVGSFHRRADLDPASYIDLTRSYRGAELLDLLRARTFPPHPACWFEDGGERYEVRVEICKVNPKGGS